MSPLIVDPTPVVIDALVANMINRPTFLPPETDFAAIAAVKIAEHYGFDTARTTEAARQLAALLKDPDVTSMTPGQRNNTLRTQAREPAPLAGKGAHAAQRQDVPSSRPQQLRGHPEHRIRRARSRRRRRRRDLPPCYGRPRQPGVSAKRAPSTLP